MTKAATDAPIDPAENENASLCALRDGLPDGPWSGRFELLDGLGRSMAMVAIRPDTEAVARAIVAIPSMLEEIKRLRGQAPQHVAAIDRLRAYGADKQAEIQKLRDENENLDAACKIEHRESDRLRIRIAELETTIAKLNAELCEALKAAAPHPRHPMLWDYQEEPDIEGGAS